MLFSLENSNLILQTLSAACKSKRAEREKLESQFSKHSFWSTLRRMDDGVDQLDFNFASDDLLEFPRDLGEEGYFQFHSEQKQAFQALEARFGIAINKRVRLRLRGWDEEFEGKLLLDSLLLPSIHDETIRLRLGKMAFDHTDIEYCESV
jgi:hypothetical protein